MTKKIIFRLCMTVSLLICFRAHGQTPTYPESTVDQSYIPSSPNSQSFQSFGNEPVTLFEGAPAINISIYTVKCGSLTLPISLSYNYNGFCPLQDAGWVGLGWNLNAGGVVSRIVEGQVDNLESYGYNYNQYTLADSLIHSNDLDSFLQRGYNPDLAYGRNAYDFAPDIFDAEFNGYSNKFFYYNNKAYLLSYTKALQISIPTPTGAITITTDDGTQYFFSQSNQETTTSKYYGGRDSTTQSYISAWFLSQVVSADTKDTIELLYGSNTWSQAQISYQTSYTLSTGTQGDMGYDPLSFPIAPSIQTQTLKTILCRNSRISFISDSASRTDVLGAYPRLKEIDVIDSLTGSIVKKNTFNYEYFGQSSGTPVAAYERLALKNFNSVNPLLSTDSLSYNFKYIGESGTFPPKGTYGVDYWGYYNGQGGNITLIPPPGSTFYSPSPPSGATFGSGTNRDPSINYNSIGALDTLIYPSGGYTAFTYEQNQYNGGSYNTGPGIRLKSSTTVSNNSTSPPIQKTYSYFLDDGSTSSGVVTNAPNYTGPPFVINNIGTMNNYNTYRTPTNSSGIGGINPLFYYQKVSETIASGSETHKTDHYFTSFGAIYLDVRETQRVEYSNSNYPNIFIPVTRTVTNYRQFSPDLLTSFTYVNPYIDTEYTNNAHSPKIWYSYSYNENFWNPNGVRPGSQIVTQYDKLGDSISTTTSYSYDSTTFNLSSVTTQNLSDGQTIIQRFKYPEDYSSGLTGNMVTARVLRPVIERQTWLYKNSSDSVLITGNITSYDQTSFKLVNSYAIETTKPITSLNNETKSGGKFTSILSDSRYVLKGQISYDGNNNLSVANKASDINVSYIWDYRHSNPIAEVKNAAQADIAYTSFESDGKGNWTFTGTANADTTSPTGSNCYNLGQTSGNITKSGLTSANNYIISYWLKRNTPLTITGTASGYPLQGKTINGWTYFEHKITGQTSVTVSGIGTLYIDELRLYPYSAQMKSYTYYPLIGMSSQCDADNRISYYQYDPFGRLKVVKDQDHNIIKTVQYHYIGETNE